MAKFSRPKSTLSVYAFWRNKIGYNLSLWALNIPPNPFLFIDVEGYKRYIFGELLSYSKHILGQRETLENFDICTRNVIIKFQYQAFSNFNPNPTWENTFSLNFIVLFLLTKRFFLIIWILLEIFYIKMYLKEINLFKFRILINLMNPGLITTTTTAAATKQSQLQW